MRQSIGTIALLVKDYDEAISYFTRVLGFRLVEDTALGEGKRWVLVTPPGAGATRLLLEKAQTPEQISRIGNQTGGRVFLFLHTDDFSRDYRRLLSLGVEFREEPRVETYGTVAIFLDLYGNQWDLLQSDLRDPDIESDKAALEVEKLKSEIERTRLEVVQLRLPWWKKPVFWTPVTLAVLALLGGVFSGFFDRQRARLEVQNAELEKTKVQLGEDIASQRDELSSLRKTVEDLRGSTELMKYTTGLDRTGVPREIVEAISSTQRQEIATKNEVRELAETAGLLRSHEGRQINFTDGDVSWWSEQDFPAWRIELEFFARRMVLDEANRRNITITDTGDLSNLARPVFSVLYETAQLKWSGG